MKRLILKGAWHVFGAAWMAYAWHKGSEPGVIFALALWSLAAMEYSAEAVQAAYRRGRADAMRDCRESMADVAGIIVKEEQ